LDFAVIGAIVFLAALGIVKVREFLRKPREMTLKSVDEDRLNRMVHGK